MFGSSSGEGGECRAIHGVFFPSLKGQNDGIFKFFEISNFSDFEYEIASMARPVRPRGARPVLGPQNLALLLGQSYAQSFDFWFLAFPRFRKGKV